MTEPRRTPRPLAVAGGSAAILGLAAAIAVLIQMTEPDVVREGAVKRTAMLVEVTTVEQGTFTPTLVAMGRVRPSQQLDLSPRVAGEVVEIAPQFVPGRVVSRGDVLVRLDPTDARVALVSRGSALRQAEAQLELEKGRQEVARTERSQLRREVSAEQESRMLREPQLRVAEAEVESAQAATRQAELLLQRTAVVAPFRALVTERSVAVGALVAPGTPLGRLVAVDRFWVELTLPVGQLRHLDTPAEGVAPVEAQLRDRAAWPADVHRVGHLDGIVRQLDEETRLVRLLVVVEDPLAEGLDGPPLLAGTWVEASIPAAPIEGAIRLDRALLRRNDTVWVQDGDALRVRTVDVALQDAEYAYIVGGLSPDARVVTTNLATVSDGAPLRTESP